MPAEELSFPLVMAIHVVTNRSQIPLQRPYVVGSWQRGEVWVLASPTGGRYYVEPWILGHEILHELHNIDGRIPNPDEVVVRFP